jgi:hypothetical protein
MPPKTFLDLGPMRCHGEPDRTAHLRRQFQPYAHESRTYGDQLEVPDVQAPKVDLPITAGDLEAARLRNAARGAPTPALGASLRETWMMWLGQYRRTELVRRGWVTSCNSLA